MKKNIKKIKMLFLITLVFVLVGCGNNSGNSKKNNIKPNNNSVTTEEKNTFEELSIKKGETKEFKGSYSGKDIKAEITLKDFIWTTNLIPPNPTKSIYTYYEAGENYAYIVLEMEVKNTGTDSFNDYIFSDFLFDNCTPTLIYEGDYKYTGISLVELVKDSSNRYDFNTFYSINPLEKKLIYTMTKIPLEVVQKNITQFNICFGDNKLNIYTE